MKKMKTNTHLPCIILMPTLIMAVVMISFVGCKEDDDMPSVKISDVTITPSESSIPRGFALEFIATVVGDNITEANKTVKWTVTGGTKQETAITDRKSVV